MTHLNHAIIDARRLEAVDGRFCAPGPRASCVRVNVEEGNHLQSFALHDVGQVHAVTLKRSTAFECDRKKHSYKTNEQTAEQKEHPVKNDIGHTFSSTMLCRFLNLWRKISFAP